MSLFEDDRFLVSYLLRIIIFLRKSTVLEKIARMSHVIFINLFITQPIDNWLYNLMRFNNLV